MKEENKRKLYLKIRVSEEEMNAIKKKQQNSGIPTMSDFVRAMIFRGVIINIDKSFQKTINILVSNIANNVNQIAYKVNQTGNVYYEDITQIQDEVHQIQQMFLKLLAHVSMAKPKVNLKDEIDSDSEMIK